MNTRDIEDKFEFAGHPKRGIAIVRGKGSLVWDDEEGKEYIDCVAGQGVANVGHCNPKVVEAIREQSDKLITCPGIFYNDQRAKLLQKLSKISGLDKAFLCNSGAESVEAAIKFARSTTGRRKIVGAMRGFHGRTFGALSATHKPKYRKGIGPVVPGFEHVPFNNIEKLEEVVDEKTAAVILEVVQGEGGVNVGSRDYFEKARKLCDDTGALLIIDEVQTGFCRTGRMFAIQHFNIKPDIMCVAKAMGGGVPTGATLCKNTVKVPEAGHSSTFGGNPLSCAAANAAIEFMLEQDLAGAALEKGNYLMEKLRKADLEKVREIRGMGLIIGIELKEKVKDHIINLMKEGVLVLAAGTTVIRLLPPLTITKEEMDSVVEKLVSVLKT